MSFRDIFIKKLHQLPNDILQEVYYLDVVISKGTLQWNSYLASKYRGCKTVIPDPNFLEFWFHNWCIKKEKEEE